MGFERSHGTGSSRRSVLQGAAAFGAMSAENLGDAIVLTVIISLISTILLFFLPLSPLWQQVWVSAWTGLCGARIILGTYNEFFHHKEYGNVGNENNENQ